MQIQKKLLDEDLLACLEKGILHFVQSKSINDSYQKTRDLKNKWRALQDQNDLTDMQRDKLLMTLIEDLNLEVNSVFELCDNFFEKYPNELSIIVMWQSQIDKIQQNKQPQITQNSQQRYDSFVKQLSEDCQLISEKVKKFYFEERNSFIQILQIIVFSLQTQPSNQNDCVNVLRNFGGKLLQKQDFCSNIVRSLVRNLNWQEEFKISINKDENLREYIFDSIQKEQIMMLSTLFQVFLSQEQQKNNLVIDPFLDYLQQTEFLGQIQTTIKNQIHRQFIGSQQLKKKEIIKNLGQMCALAMLDITKPLQQGFIQPKHIIKKEAITPASLIVYLPILERTNQINNFSDRMSEIFVLEEIKEIINSNLIQQPYFSENLRTPFIQHIQKWLDILFQYQVSKGNGQDEKHLIDIQQLGSQILKDKIIIEKVWEQGLESLAMFRQYFKHPMKFFQQIMPLLDILCGKKQFRYANNVLEFLKDRNLLSEFFIQITKSFEQFQLGLINNEEDFNLFSSMCIVLAKIIKQDKDQFAFLNEAYKNLKDQKHQNQVKFNSYSPIINQQFTQPPSISRISHVPINTFQDCDFPILTLLTKIIHALIEMNLEYTFLSRPLSNLIEAVTKIFSFEDIRSQIIELLKNKNSFTGGYSLFEYMNRQISINYQNIEKDKLIGKTLNLITHIFQVEFPQKYLSTDDMLRIEESILGKSLILVYKPLLEQTFDKRFDRRTGLCYSTTLYLLKLTKILLKKFNQVSDNGQKVLLTMPFPQFDMLFEIIQNSVNSDQIFNICVEMVNLCQNNSSEPNQFENSLAFQGVAMISQKAIKFQIIIQKAIQILCTILQLGLSQSKNQLCSRQSHYIKKLQPVRNLQRIIKQRSNAFITLEGRQIDLNSMIAYYLNPNNKEISVEFIKVEALQFLSLSTRIITYDLYQQLYSTYGANLQQQLLQNFTESLIDQKNLGSKILNYLDFWIIAVDKQERLVQELWRTEIAKLFITCLQWPSDNNTTVILLKIKICILVSLMSEKNCCIEFINFNGYKMIEVLYDQVIEKNLNELIDETQLNGQYLQSQQRTQVNAIIQDLIRPLNTKIAVSYFYKLLQTEINRDPNSKCLRNIVLRVEENQNLAQLGLITQSVTRDAISLFDNLQQLNEQILKQQQSRNTFEQLRLHQQIKNYLGDQNELFSEIKSKDGSIFFQNFENEQLTKTLSNTPSYLLINESIDYEEQLGVLGSQFIIDVQEFFYVFQGEKYQFNDDDFVHSCSYLLQEYNLLMSGIYADHLVVKSKTEFILGVSQSWMRLANQNDQIEQIITASVQPLVQSEDYQQLSDARKADLKHQLILKSKNRIIRIQDSLISLSGSGSYLLLNAYNSMMQNLIVHLSILSHILKTLDNQNDPQQLQLQMLNLLTNLSNLSLQNNESCFSQFSQVCLQVFQILATLNSKPQETVILKNLSKVIDQMKLGFSFNEGLQILNIVCDILETDKMVNFMKKNNSQALNIILNKFNDKNASKFEISQILTLLSTYAKTIEGSIHLNQLKILEKIEPVCGIIENQNLYYVENNKQVRNPLHIQWLQILVIVRQMNTNLLQSPRSEHIDYFKKQCSFINRLQYRFVQMLEVCLGCNVNASINQTYEQRTPVITLAIFEEIEIICSVVSQLFDHADLWAEKDFDTYCDFKDMLLIAVPLIVKNQVQGSLISSSNTENQLSQIKQSEKGSIRTALSLKLEQSFIRTMLTCASSLYNVCSLGAESQIDLVNTWSNLRQDINQSSFISKFLAQSDEPPINCAFENFRQGMENLNKLYNEYNCDQMKEIKILVQKTAALFKNDMIIIDEYSADISALLVEENFDELVQLIEITLQMGLYVLTTLLEKIQKISVNQGNWISNKTATPYDKLRMQSVRNSQSQFLQDHHLQNLANQLQKLIQNITQSLKLQSKILYGNQVNYLDFLYEKAGQIGEQLGLNNYY